MWSDGRLYVYPSRDIDPARGCDFMDRYHVFSTDDMAHWRDEGEILNASQVEWGRKEGGFMWAPDCAYRNGTYYFYFPHPSGSNWDTTWKVGIATSSRPASDFKSVGYIEGLGGKGMIDPSVFIDTDGKVYIYYGGGRVCQGGQLKDNMTELSGEMQPMKGLVDFHEATWVFKRDSIYYLTYADNNPVENQLRYAISNNPLGPWEHKGVFLGTTGCDTNHGSVVKYKNKWYVFYHNKAISNTGKGNLRSICVDELNFNDDGSIQLVKQTKTGVLSLPSKPLAKEKKTQYLAEKASLESGIVLKNDAAGKYVTGFGAKNSAIVFNNIASKGGRVTVDICYAANAYAKVKLFVNDTDYLFLNALPTRNDQDFTGHAALTVVLPNRSNNTIKIIGGNGDINIKHITVSALK